MTTTTTAPLPLPPGATGASGWDEWDDKFRIVHFDNSPLEGTDAYIWASAIQSPDGRIDDGGIEPPCVNVETPGAVGLTTAQARELARQIVAAADLLDGWVTR